jgi:hypothetical protein
MLKTHSDKKNGNCTRLNIPKEQVEIFLGILKKTTINNLQEDYTPTKTDTRYLPRKVRLVSAPQFAEKEGTLGQNDAEMSRFDTHISTSKTHDTNTRTWIHCILRCL